MPKQPRNSPRGHWRRRSAPAATPLALALALAAPALALDLKPGDIVVGTAANSSFGSGQLYVVDPIAGTVTAVPNTSFANGIGALALDANDHIIIGTTTNQASSAGALYRVDVANNSVTPINTTDAGNPVQFFNGVTALTLDAGGNALVGTGAASTFGAGSLYTVNLTTAPGATARVNLNTGGPSPQPVTITNAIDAAVIHNGRYYLGSTARTTTGAGFLYDVDPATGVATAVNLTAAGQPLSLLNGASALTVDPNGNLLLGTKQNSTTGRGSVYSVNPATGVATALNLNNGAPQPETVDLYNGVGALTTDFYGNVFLASAASTTHGAGKLYQLNPVTGVVTEVVPNFFLNAITGVAVVGPQEDFTGGNNVTINGATARMIGGPDFFSSGNSAVLSVAQLLTTLDTSATGASVRTGNAGANTEDGDLTVAAALDFSGIGTSTLTLRATDDLFVNGTISDLTAGGDTLNLTLIAANARRDARVTAANITGRLLVTQAIDLAGGDLTASGLTFDNTGGALAADAADLAFTETATVAADITATTLDATVGSFDHTGGTISVSGAANLTATGNVAVGSSFDAATLTSTGVDFTVAAGGSATTTTGPIGLAGHTGNVSVAGALDSQDNLTIGSAAAPAASITTTGTLTVNNDGELHSSGAVDLGGDVSASALTVTASSFDISGTSFTVDNQLAISAGTGPVTIGGAGATVGSLITNGSDFTINADLTTTNGGVDLTGHSGGADHTGHVAVNADTDVDFTSGGSSDFRSTGQSFTLAPGVTLNVGGQLDLTGHTAAIQLDGAVTANNGLSSRGTTFTLGSAATLDAPGGDITLDHTGHAVDLQAPVTAGGSFSSTGSAFDSTDLTAGGDLDLNHSAAVTLGGALDIGAAATVTTTGGDANFTGAGTTLQVGGDLTIDAAGNVSFTDSNTTLAANSLASAGADFTLNTATTISGMSASGEGIDLSNHTGRVEINSAVELTAGDANFLAGGSSFNSNAPIRVTDAVIEVSSSGAIQVDDVLEGTSGANLTGAYLRGGSVLLNAPVTASDASDLSASAGDITIAAGAPFTTGSLSAGGSGAFDLQADLTATAGDVQLTQGGDLTLAGNVLVSSGAFSASGGELNLTGTLDTQGLVTLDQSGEVHLNNTVTAGGLSVLNSASFENGGGELNISGDVDITSGGQVDLDAAVQSQGFASVSTGGAFNLNAMLTSSSGAVTLDHAGYDVTLSQDLLVQGGDFASTGAAFLNGAAVDVSGTATLNHTGTVAVNAPLAAGALDVQSSDSFANTDTLTIDGAATINATLTVDLNAIVAAGSFASTGGGAFTNTAALTTTAGGVTLDHAGQAVAIDAAVITTGGGFASTGSTFTSTAPITADGAASLTHSNAVAINHTLAAQSLDATGTTFDNTAGAITLTGPGVLDFVDSVTLAAAVNATGLTSSGVDFTGNATLTTTTGGVDLTGHSGVITINQAVTATTGGFAAAGSSFDSNAAINVGGASSVNVSGPIIVNAAFDAGSLAATGSSFDNTGGALTTTGATSIAATGAVNLAAGVSATGLTSSGTTFTNSAAVTTTTGGVNLAGHTDAVTINQTITATTGGFASAGSAFDANAAITVGGAATLNHTGPATLNAAFAADSLTATVGSFDNTGGPVTLTGPAVLSAVGSVNLAANLTATGLTSSGTTFTSAAPIATTTGGVNLAGHTGNVTINQTITATTGGFASAGSAFDANAAISVGGTATLSHTGPATLNAAFAADSLTATVGSFDNTGGPITLPGAAVINATGSVALRAATGVGSLQSTGTTFTSTAALTAAGDVTIDHSGALSVGAALGGDNVTFEGASFTNTAGPVTAVGSMIVDVTGNVGVNANVNAFTFSSKGVNYDSRLAVTTVTDAMTLQHTGSVLLGDTTAGALALGNANSVTINNTFAVDVDTLDLGNARQLTINTGGVLDVAGAFNQSANTVTLAGGLLRTSDLQTSGGTFNFFFGEVNVTTNLDIGDGFASERVLGLTPDVTSGQTLRVTDTTTLYEPFFIRGGTFITGKLVNRFLLNFEYGTLRILGSEDSDLVVGDDGQYGPQYALGRTGSNQQVIQLYAGTGGAGTITVRPEGTFLLEGGKAFAEGGTFNTGTIQFDDALSELSGGDLTNQAGGIVYGRGKIAARLVNQAGGSVSATSSLERLTFTAAGGTNAGSIQSLNGGIVELLGGFTNQAAGVLSANNGVFNVGTLTSYSLPWNATGKHLNNFGQMQFAGQSTVNGDVVMQPGSKMTISGAGQTSIFGRLYGLGSELRASTSDSRIVVFQAARGFFTLSGTGQIKFEGGLSGLSPAYSSSTAGSAEFEDNSGQEHLFTFTIDGTRRADQDLYNKFQQWSIGTADPVIPDDFRNGYYGAFDATVLKLFGNNMSILVELWGVHGTQNPDLYTLKAGDVFELLRFNSIEVALSAAANPHDLVDLILPQLGDGLSWHVEWDLLTTDGDAGSLTLTVIPEPATALLAAPLLLALTRRRRAA